jgi:CRP-like cAMP-binding protein
MSAPLQLSIVNFTRGAYIIVEGKANADFFFIIRSGRVRISKEVQVVDEEGGNVLGPGDFFGVVSTMSSHSHIETAQAIDEVSLISVHREQYGLLIERNTPVAMKIIESFSRRMRFLDAALARLTLKSNANEGDISHIFGMAEYYVRQSQYNQAFYCYYQYLKHCPSGQHVVTARERLAKIKPYAKAVYLDGDENVFTRNYPKDTMIFCENMPGKEMYIIQKGSIKITKIVNDNEVLLAVLKQGDMFGEMSLIESKPRSASAIAFDDAVLLAVNKENSNTLGRMYDALMIQLEKARVPARPGEAYTFDFGIKELINMVGLPMAEGNQVIRELLRNTKIKQLENKLHATDVSEIEKQAKYYRNMERIERKRREQRRMA